MGDGQRRRVLVSHLLLAGGHGERRRIRGRRDHGRRHGLSRQPGHERRRDLRESGPRRKLEPAGDRGRAAGSGHIQDERVRISRSPDQTGLWYVGTDFGVAISTDDGATWTHKTLETTSPPMVQATLAFPQGPVLALATRGLYRSDDRGATWRSVIADSFTQYFPYGVNKMDRSPYSPWAFILREYHFSSDPNPQRDHLVLRARHGHEDAAHDAAGHLARAVLARDEGTDHQRIRAVAHQAMDRPRLGRLPGDPVDGGGVPRARRRRTGRATSPRPASTPT